MPDFDLPASLQELLRPLTDLRPPMSAMSTLVGDGPSDAAAGACVEAIVGHDAITPALEAGLWLYVDELGRSHRVSQSIDDTTGSFWHGIMHRREGDFSNSHHWFRKAGDHPAMATIPGYEAHGFIDAVAAWSGGPAEDAKALVAMQRREWMALFRFSAGEGG